MARNTPTARRSKSGRAPSGELLTKSACNIRDRALGGIEHIFDGAKTRHRSSDTMTVVGEGMYFREIRFRNRIDVFWDWCGLRDLEDIRTENGQRVEILLQRGDSAILTGNNVRAILGNIVVEFVSHEGLDILSNRK